MPEKYSNKYIYAEARKAWKARDWKEFRFYGGWAFYRQRWVPPLVGIIVGTTVWFSLTALFGMFR